MLDYEDNNVSLMVFPGIMSFIRQSILKYIVPAAITGRMY